MRWHAFLGSLLMAIALVGCHQTPATPEGQPDLVVEQVFPARGDSLLQNDEPRTTEPWVLAISIRNSGTASACFYHLLIYYSSSQADYAHGEFGHGSAVDVHPAVLAPGEKGEANLWAFVEPGMENVRLLVNGNPDIPKLWSSGRQRILESN